jgi:hypothetical protein
MPEYIARNVSIIDFSNPRKIHLPEVYQPQSCIIKMESGTTDIGSHCYTVRKLNKNGIATNVVKNTQGISVIEVVLNSLDESRIAFIKKIIEFIANRAKSAGQVTLINDTRYILSFIRFYFAQSNLDYFNPDNQSHYEEAARRYSAVLKADKKLGMSAKGQLTRITFTFAEFIFDEVELNAFDYDIIPVINQKTSGTTPLLPEELELALALRTRIFEGVLELLINNRTLPYPLKVPGALCELNHTIFLGYSPWAGSCYFPRNSDFEKRQVKEWFNRDTGTLVTQKQWLDRADHKSNTSAHDSWANIQKTLRTNNSDRSILKQTLAEYAGTCFIDLLLSMTGMNQQPALDLPWYGGYFIQKSKQGNKTITLLKPEDQSDLERVESPHLYLRSIKNRKGYQPVEVTISNRFLPQFKRYLQLRHYYLNGRTDARLFPLSAKLIGQKREALHRAFPETHKLSTHQARASVSDNILTTTNDPHVAAQVLQNDPKTVIKHYAAGTQKGHIKGMGGFFNELGNQIKVTRKSDKTEIETAVGSCKNGGVQPAPLPNAPISSNCTQQEGCFFCRHFFVHADEIDIRKLFSVLYFINKGAIRAHDVDFFNDLFELVIRRIKELLEQIEAISAQKRTMVARIKDEVFTEEALDDYWLAKLNRLEMLIGEY